MALRLNKKAERIFLGIASSVAKASGFNWLKTIEIANKLNVSIIQFHLNQFYPEFDWETNLRRFEKIYIHLPVNFNNAHPFINTVKTFSKKPLLIQHERYFAQNDIFFFREYQFPLGFENDQNDNYGGYFKQLNTLYSAGINLTAVLDLPRFFYQFSNNYTENDIYNYILDILNWCKDNNISVIIHAIDIVNYHPHHSNWVPIFQGFLPWNDFLSYILKEFIPVQSIIFEYENIANTVKSVYALREWFKKFVM